MLARWLALSVDMAHPPKPLAERRIFVADAVLCPVRCGTVTVRIVLADRFEIDARSRAILVQVSSITGSPRQSGRSRVTAYANAASPCRSRMPCSHSRSGLTQHWFKVLHLQRPAHGL